jgi:pimeloyl-ACP methyl ester carboxylesterase
MATFVLVHGAWHGGWCWKKVVPLLRNADHTVFTPTLTGLGERAHLLAPTIDLTTHVNDILSLLEYEDLQQVILVGHSYAGMVISSVAAVAGQRLRHLVYLDAFVPESGEAVIDYFAPGTFEAPTQAHGDGWRLPKPDMSVSDIFGVTAPTDLAWMRTRIGDHPYKTLTQPVLLTTPTERALQHTFIQTSMDFTEAANRAMQRGYRYYALLSADHDAMVTQPAELAQIFLELV